MSDGTMKVDPEGLKRFLERADNPSWMADSTEDALLRALEKREARRLEREKEKSEKAGK